MSHKFIRPFGPTIYHGVLDKDEVWYLQQVAQDTKEGQNVGHDLAGNIKDQKGIVAKIWRSLQTLYNHTSGSI